MSSEWASASFADLMDRGALEIGDGYRAKNDELGGEGLIFLRAGHVKDTHIDFGGVDRFLTTNDSRFGPKIARAGDVVITTKGNSTGRVAYVTAAMPRFVYSPHLSYWRSTGAGVVEQGFLRAWSQSTEFLEQLAALSRSTDMAPYLSLSDQRRLRVTLPPPAAQREVAMLNDALHDRIALLRETNATLEAIAQTLFKSWFVDFDPVRAKQQGLAPAGMDEATAAMFPDGFEESTLGVSPVGWRLGVLGDFLELTKGCSYKGEGLSETAGAHMFNLGCFNAHRVFASEKVKRYTGEYRTRHAVVGGDLIVANTDMTQAREILGRPAFVPDGFQPGFISHHVFKVVVEASDADTASALRAFLFFTLQQDEFRTRAVGFATGTTVLALPAAAVTACPAIIPPGGVLLAFAGTVLPLLERIRANEVQAGMLAQLRDTLLPRLITGQLRFPEIPDERQAA